MRPEDSKRVFQLTRELILLINGMSEDDCFSCGLNKQTSHSNNFVVYKRERGGLKFNICSRCQAGLWKKLRNELGPKKGQQFNDQMFKSWRAFHIHDNFEVVPDLVFSEWMANKMLKRTIGRQSVRF